MFEAISQKIRMNTADDKDMGLIAENEINVKRRLQQ